MTFLPKVSIQIPTYNQANTIFLAVQSCLNQTYSNIEINIADDGGSDNTEEVIQPLLADERVRYFKNEKNIGRVANYRKALFEYATGEWVLNLDGDDYFINNNFIEQAIKDISNSKNEILFYLGSMKFGTFDKFHFNYPNIKERILETKALDYYKNYFKYNHFSHFGFLTNKKFLIQEKLTYSVNISSTDIITFLNICVKNKSKNIILSKDLSAFWVWTGNNFSQNLRIKDVYKSLKELYKFNLLLIKSIGVFPPIKWFCLFSFHTILPFIMHKTLSFFKKVNLNTILYFGLCNF